MGIFDAVNTSGASAAAQAAQQKVTDDRQGRIDQFAQAQEQKEERREYAKQLRKEADEKLREYKTQLSHLRLNHLEASEEYTTLEKEIEALDSQMEEIIQQEVDKKFSAE